MIFNSVTYLIFLFIVTVGYWLTPRSIRIPLIFVSSLTFYGFWKPEFLLILFITLIIDYYTAIWMGKCETASNRKFLLTLSVCSNLGLLFFFKYLYFATDNISFIAGCFGVDFHPRLISIILPLGISFYTFQTMSYTIDVYRRFIEPEKNFLYYANFVLYFPQLVAGPILRAREVIEQLKVRPPFDLQDIGHGFRRLAKGLFLKVVIADNIAPLVNSGFAARTADLSALDVWTLSFLFGLQIYFDFSAYSHIAIGSASLMGIHFPENFNFPYIASSPKDFWRRWHISLSSWIRDYLYLPIRGQKAHDHSKNGLAMAAGEKSSRDSKALFLTWMIMGLWHGANWTFFFWGLWHAILIQIYRLTTKLNKINNTTVLNFVGWSFTIPAIMLGWIFFRAPSVKTALKMYAKLFCFSSYSELGLRENVYVITFVLMIGTILSYWVFTYLSKRIKKDTAFFFLIEVIFYTAVIFLDIVFLRPIQQYIYFQF